MAFDVNLRDNGAGTFDISLSSGVATTEKSITFLGLVISQTSSTTETSCVFEE
jgi:hypothetical protein